MIEHTPAKKRVIVLANHRQARFVLAKGIKVHETILCLSNRAEEHSEPLSSPRVGHDKGTADSHFFPSHTDFKEVEKEAFAHEITSHILKVFPAYDELILACDPKMLGLLKKELNHHSSVKIYKTMPLNEVDIDPKNLEEKLWGGTEGR
jgi:protein required for attachment to host cells